MNEMQEFHNPVGVCDCAFCRQSPMLGVFLLGSTITVAAAIVAIFWGLFKVSLLLWTKP